MTWDCFNCLQPFARGMERKAGILSLYICGTCERAARVVSALSDPYERSKFALQLESEVIGHGE